MTGENLTKTIYIVAMVQRSGSSEPISPSDAVAHLAAHPDGWAHLVQHDRTERWFVRLDHDDVEAWLIGWPPGTGIPWHDHGGAPGAFTVVAGRLLESTPTARGRARRRMLGPDRVVALRPDVIHAVVNVEDRLAVSIHAYAPRLDRMTFFADDGARLRPSRREEFATASPLA